ncbi:hypothetical protein [Clostridium estertheticum]|nr:hypothetical protein [Clostridium estertheticum]
MLKRTEYFLWEKASFYPLPHKKLAAKAHQLLKEKEGANDGG